MLKEMYCGKNAAVTEVEDFFENISLEWINSQKPQVKLSTYAKYYNVLKLYLNPTFGQKHISQITRSEVLEFSRMMLTIGGSKRNGLTPKTINGALSVLKNIFWFAEVEKSCAVADIKNISVRQPQKAMRILTRSEQIALSDYLCVNQTPCHLGILLCLYTGMRIGEICALKWGDIHIDEQYLYIHQSMQRVQTSTVSKSKTVVLIQSPKSEFLHAVRCFRQLRHQQFRVLSFLLTIENGRLFCLPSENDFCCLRERDALHLDEIVQR